VCSSQTLARLLQTRRELRRAVVKGFKVEE